MHSCCYNSKNSSFSLAAAAAAYDIRLVDM